MTGRWEPSAQGVPALGDAVHVWRLAGRRPAASLGAFLARYLGVDESRVRIAGGSGVKPTIAVGADRPPLWFNVAHAGAWTLVAVSSRGEVGVDVEPLDRKVDTGLLGAHVLASSERADVDARPPDERRRAFLRAWVRKEALLKAAGVGLSAEPAAVVLDGTEIVDLPPSFGSSRWSLGDVPLDRHVAAVAVQGRPAPLRLLEAAAADGR